MGAGDAVAEGGIGAVGGGQGMAAGAAEGGVAFDQPMADRDALVEDEAFAGKAALLGGDGFEIFENAALEVEHLLEALAQQIGRGLFAAYAAGAEHGDLLVAGRIEVFAT